MHAHVIVQRFIETQLTRIHAARRPALAAAVTALMQGHCLSLSRLARGLAATTGLKAALKRIDRLIGHTRIDTETHWVAATIVARLKTQGGPLVIAIDWSAVGPGGAFVELRASATVPGKGRGITIYQHVYPLSLLGNPKAERALLEDLYSWIGPDSEVIVITDAGFRRAWFTQVERLGWGWIGRVRRGVHLGRTTARDRWCFTSAGCWFKRANGKARREHDCRLTKKAGWPCDVVLVRRHHAKRKHYRCPGHGSTSKAMREAKVSAREPWLLVHAARLRRYAPEQIVAFYASRMQIEENFRDNKSVVYGMGQDIGRSRSALRWQALLLIATLATFLLWHVGQLAEAEGLHRRFKATTRVARELSLITLARLLCALPKLPLTDFAAHVLYQRLGVRQ